MLRPGSGSGTCGSARLFERPVERVEEGHALLEQRIVVLIGELKSVDQRADGAALRRAELAVLQIQVVNDRRDSRQRRGVEAEDRAQGFEGAAPGLVAELDAEHVEWHALVGHRLGVDTEAEARLRIDEAPDQPGGRHAIDAWPRPRNPEAALKRHHPSGLFCGGWTPRTAGGRDSTLEFAKHREDAIPPGTAEEVDLLGGDQALPEDVEQTTDRRCACAPRPPGAARAVQCLCDVLRQRVVRILPRSPELLDEGVVRPGIDVVGREDRRITSRRFHLGLQPLEILTPLGRIGECIHRLLQGDGADLLKPAPGRDPEVRWLRRKLVDEQQPAATAWRRRRDWQPIGLNPLSHAPRR